MADVIPNYSLEIQGLELELSQLNHNVKSQEFRIAQMLDEASRIESNIAATRVAIAAMVDKIQTLKG